MGKFSSIPSPIEVSPSKLTTSCKSEGIGLSGSLLELLLPPQADKDNIEKLTSKKEMIFYKNFDPYLSPSKYFNWKNIETTLNLL